MCPSEFFRLVFRSNDSLDLNAGASYDFVVPGLPNTKRYKVICDEVHILYDALSADSNSIWELKTNFGVNNLLDSSRAGYMSVFLEKGNNTNLTLFKETHQVVVDKPQGNNFHFELFADGIKVQDKLDMVLSFVFQPFED